MFGATFSFLFRNRLRFILVKQPAIPLCTVRNPMGVVPKGCRWILMAHLTRNICDGSALAEQQAGIGVPHVVLGKVGQ
jgi:hypothetical protein